MFKLIETDLGPWVKLVASTIIDKIPVYSPDILKVIVKFDTNHPVFLLNPHGVLIIPYYDKKHVGCS